MKDFYTTKPGDTIWSIAKSHRMTIDELKKLNNMNTNRIYCNQIIRII